MDEGRKSRTCPVRDLWPQQSHCLATKQRVYDFSKAEKREDPDAPIVRSRKGS